MKNAYHVSTEQHENMKSGVLWSKNSASCKLGVIVHTVLLEHVKDQLSPQTCKFDRFACFCGCNCETSNIWHQRTRFFTTETG